MSDERVGLLGAREIRALAEGLDVRPTKKLGQNFVIDPNTVQRIARAADLPADATVLEVGPGLGSLTLALLQVARRVVAVEIDAVLADQLPRTVAAHAPHRVGDLTVIVDDAMCIDPARIVAACQTPRSGDSGARVDQQAGGRANESSPAGPDALVANLPYNVAVPVLLHLIEALPSVTTGLVMVQKEVADRLAAKPGSKAYGIPSVKAAWFGTVESAGSIGRRVFWPEPNVDSGLVRFTRHEPPVCTSAREQVFAVIDAAFAQRRKVLRGALAGLAGSADAAAAALERAGIAPTARGEQLTVADFARLADALHG